MIKIHFWIYLAVAAAIGNAAPLQLHAKSWTQAGRVMHSTDTLQTNFNGNWEQSMGMQINGSVDLGESMEGGFGFGLQQVYHSLGNLQEEKFALSKFVNYIADAHLSYFHGGKENPSFTLTLGNFAYNYAPNVKNLGLYLFRGPVYPGFLVSGFKDYHTDTTRASFLGARFNQKGKKWEQDLIVSSERDLPPSFDWSIGYVGKWLPVEGFTIGAGIQLYHVLPENKQITTPDDNAVRGLFSKDSNRIANATVLDPYELEYIEVLGPGDTLVYSHQGTKVMGMVQMDLKPLFGLDAGLGKRDMVLYGEAAIIGLKNQGSIYSKMKDRMPVMVGFNLPTWGKLDFISIEVEHYSAKYKADYSKLGKDQSLRFKNIAPPQLISRKQPSAIPVSTLDVAGDRYTITPEGNFQNIQTGEIIPIKGTGADPAQFTGDDWKWSLNLEKTIAQHVQFSGQVANDHFIPRPVRGGLISEKSGMSEILTSMKDWYFMVRIGYFF